MNISFNQNIAIDDRVGDLFERQSIANRRDSRLRARYRAGSRPVADDLRRDKGRYLIYEPTLHKRPGQFASCLNHYIVQTTGPQFPDYDRQVNSPVYQGRLQYRN